MTNGLLKLLLSKSQNGSGSVDLMRFGIELKSNFDFARRFVVAVFLRQDPCFDSVRFGQIWVE